MPIARSNPHPNPHPHPNPNPTPPPDPDPNLQGVESGLPLAIAMSLHNIPEGMAVAGPLYAATKSKTKASQP